MAIQELEIHGYRSFKEATWRPGKLNLLVGANGSGKSNLLRLLQLISQAATGKLYSEIFQEGEGFHPLQWNHDLWMNLYWKITLDPLQENDKWDAWIWELCICDEIGTGTGSGDIVELDILEKKPRANGGEAVDNCTLFKRDMKDSQVLDKTLGELTSFREIDPCESLFSQVDVSTSSEIPRTKLALGLWGIYLDFCVDDSSEVRKSHSPQHIPLLGRQGNNLTQVLHTLYSTSPDFKGLIDDGMRAAFGSNFKGLTFPAAGRGQIQLAIQWETSADPHSGIELSDGTLRFLMLLTILANPNPHPLIAIDEPETGLHPSMLPIIAEYAIAASEKTQVVISSHSPEFLDYFTDADSHVTVFQWEDAQSKIYDLPGETLSPWLEKYRLGEMFTSNELELLAQPPGELPDDIDTRFADLPSEDETMPIQDVEAGGDNSA